MKHRYKSIDGAVRRIRNLEKMIARYEGYCLRYEAELKAVSMMAADGPAFDNSLVAMGAKEIRDRVLREKCGLQPDGQPHPLAS